uniref:cAMP-responsive element-binding protein-like 2 n=1 Tax=Equus asinus asinus TaxID=83772 RepID=A0A8C4M7P4_EQUAS
IDDSFYYIKNRFDYHLFHYTHEEKNYFFLLLLKVVGGKVKKPGKRGRKPAKIDLKAKLERSRQSARECRARKKLRYQYLEELVSSRERAICALREELEMVRKVQMYTIQ